MKVNYVLMYGIPYVRYKEFETFEDCSKFLVNKSIVNYSIFKKLDDKDEVEMIYRDSDIHYLENFVKEQDEKIQKLQGKNEELMTLYTTEREVKEDYKSIIKEVKNYIKEFKEPVEVPCYEHYYKEIDEIIGDIDE